MRAATYRPSLVVVDVAPMNIVRISGAHRTTRFNELEYPMSTIIRRISGTALILVATVLSHHFVDYRLEPVQTARGSRDFIVLERSELLFLGWTSIAPPPGSEAARFHARTPVERGLFARDGYTVSTAVIAGLLAPLLLFGWGIWLILGKKNPPTG